MTLRFTREKKDPYWAHGHAAVRTKDRLLEKCHVDGTDLHGSGGAGRYTELADTAFFLKEGNLHFGPYHRKRTRGAHGRAGPAVGAFIFHPLDLLGGILHLDAHLLQIGDAFPEVFAAAGQFHDHDAFLAWQDGSVQDVESQVIVLYQVADDGLGSDCF